MLLTLRVTTAGLVMMLALVLSGCAGTEDRESGSGNGPVPTPVPTETEQPEAEPTETPATPATPEPQEEGGRNGEWYELLVTEKTYPEEKIGEQVLALAEDGNEFAELWEWFNLDQEAAMPEVDWNTTAVLFAGTGESGGCPLVLDIVDFDQEEGLIKVGASKDVAEDIMCTMDWTPRVFVIALDADDLGEDELRAVIYDTEYEDQIDPESGEVIRES
jgi:hypothetical protein